VLWRFSKTRGNAEHDLQFERAGVARRTRDTDEWQRMNLIQ
jgi:hypothetical protein